MQIRKYEAYMDDYKLQVEHASEITKAADILVMGGIVVSEIKKLKS